ncbi:N-acetylglucosamine kinase [Lacrimispora saccharolytica]|uniref:ATPase BadF/BadG/BcrA/BcrD type n=1 Tax=Lacrimispora saccharolytica (strain ATCC 35040 / DSM 2544 / NRCC 2533 / WM1) TaxID=610130 RepID=D9RAJ0_LACSW|nr:BadF/BadG/BcrA/BcrD ATPase family protein [Lacrimispora saccharolytica]ADL04268.1 ATPase BadF/BadG/BcrA/BcrD type [[Clostridium] saccharolyticum WM1]QRV21454.1 ATPase [Lacrimispora saccharolytica]
MKEYFAGLDIGGTNGRLKICDPHGAVLGEFTAPGCSLNTDGAEKSRLRYRDLVLPALRDMNLAPGCCAGICVAASGIDSPSDEHDCRSIFEEMGFPNKKLLVLNDCEVFLHMTEEPALVVISGTGSVCFGRDKDGTIYRTGGWNHIISDEGSGFDMGLKVLKAVGDELSGRIKCPVLTPLIIKETGLDTLEKIDDFINANLMEKSEIARLSLFAYQAAALGDHEAVRIHRECGEALWGLIRDTAAKMAGKSPEDRRNLWLWGSVLVKNQIIRKMVEEKVREGMPGTEVGIPALSALDTALKAARSLQ